MKFIFFLILPLLLTAAFPVRGQESEPKRIGYKGDRWEFSREIWPDGPRIIGNVVMDHDSAYLYCDSAYVNETANRVIAYGKVNVRLSDTLNLYGDSIKYDGNTRIANAFGNVRLVDNQTVLTTDTLHYDRNTRIARYDWWGKIVSDSNFLVSKSGKYFTDRKEFFFREKVILTSPDYRMFSDTLMYQTVTEVAHFFGPTHIISNDKKDSIYCENGWYDTRLDISRFRDRARIYHETSLLTGDSMYYERKTGFGQVHRNALLMDSVNNVMLTGHYGELHRRKGNAFMTDSAVGVLIDGKDSLFIHGDTVRAFFDSATKIREMRCYRGVRFFRQNLQGLCDSLTFLSADSTLNMYRDPVLWSDSNQLTADSIRLTLRNGQADSLKLFGSAFIASRDDSAAFNQIKGRKVLAKFAGNSLHKILVIGNAQTLYYTREEDKSLIGINTAISAEILIFLEKNKMQSITYIGNPDAHLLPENTVPPGERKLKGFRWEEEKRPAGKWDIFR